MIKNVKKISALILSTVLMTESVSAASLNGLDYMLKNTASFLMESSEKFISSFDDATSEAAIEDDIVSGQAVISEDAEYILNNYSVYSELNNIEKRILNYELGVRNDTMELLQDRGYMLRESVPFALIMQRMNFGVSQAKEMVEKLGENLALSQSLKFRKLEIYYGDRTDNKFTAENIAKLMADGYNESEAISLFIM